MKLTTKMRYGTRAMIDLALHQDAGPVTLKEIAQRQALSVKYLERLVATLQASGLVRAARGRRGGYMLARPANQITLRELYEALEGAGGFVDCTAEPQACPRWEMCVTQEVWAQLAEACMDVLASVNLGDLARRAREKGALPDDYSI